ncbi:MAG: hypothetical protein AAGF84_01045 [Planctomycetota bacterium]
MKKRTWLDKIETWIVVTLITVLVWLYAEGAIVERHPNESITVRFTAAGGVPMQIEPDLQQVTVTFRSNGPVYQQFQTLTNNQTIDLEVEPAVGEDAGQAQPVDVRARLEAALFTPLGVAVDEMSPQLVDVTARRLVKRTIPVVVRDDELDLRSPPTVDPAAVTVTLPEDLAMQLDAENAASPSSVAAVVNLTRVVRENPQVPGEAVVLTLAIEPPVIGGEVISALQTREADVSYTLADREGNVTLTSMPLRRLTPFEFPYTIVVSNNAKVLNDVKLTGPVESLEQIEAGEVPVWAELHFFDATQWTAGEATVAVNYHLPPGVSAPLRQVNVELRERTDDTSGVAGQ